MVKWGRKKHTATIVMTRITDDVTMVNTNLHGKVDEKETHCYDSHDKITDDVTMVNTNLHGKVEEKETLLR